jgi:acyl-CoA thioester hydrolase
MSATEELLEPYPITMQIPVYWGDHDAMQHVNNTVYIRWMEHVRLLFFDAIGVSESMKQTGVGTILASIQCRYRAPVTFPDTIHAGARAVSLGEDRMVIHHWGWSPRKEKGWGCATITGPIRKRQCPLKCGSGC